MGLALFAIMIAVPILEIAVFILVGRYIGLWPTLAGIVLTALVGTMIIRHQGTGLVAKARRSIAAGEAPVGEVLQGLALLAAGALLITPGFITDTLGFLFLVPPLRKRLAGLILAQAARQATVHVHAATTGAGPRTGSGPGARPGAGAGRPVIIEGEWQEVEPTGEDESGSPRPGRGWGPAPKPPAGDGDDVDEVPPAKRAGG